MSEVERGVTKPVKLGLKDEDGVRARRVRILVEVYGHDVGM